jgi:hypothetical protein
MYIGLFYVCILRDINNLYRLYMQCLIIVYAFEYVSKISGLQGDSYTYFFLEGGGGWSSLFWTGLEWKRFQCFGRTYLYLQGRRNENGCEMVYAQAMTNGWTA